MGRRPKLGLNQALSVSGSAASDQGPVKSAVGPMMAVCVRRPLWKQGRTQRLLAALQWPAFSITSDLQSAGRFTPGNSHFALIRHGPLQQLDAMRKRALHQ